MCIAEDFTKSDWYGTAHEDYRSFSKFQETESWWKVQCTILIKYSELKVQENKT